MCSNLMYGNYIQFNLNVHRQNRWKKEKEYIHRKCWCCTLLFNIHWVFVYIFLLIFNYCQYVIWWWCCCWMNILQYWNGVAEISLNIVIWSIEMNWIQWNKKESGEVWWVATEKKRWSYKEEIFIVLRENAF